MTLSEITMSVHSLFVCIQLIVNYLYKNIGIWQISKFSLNLGAKLIYNNIVYHLNVVKKA